MKKRNLVLVFSLILLLGINVNAASCQAIFGSKLINEVKNIFKIVQIAAPIILVLMTSIDFAKVVFSDAKDGMKKAMNDFLKRAVAVFIIFFSPYIITLIMKLVDLSSGCVSEF